MKKRCHHKTNVKRKLCPDESDIKKKCQRCHNCHSKNIKARKICVEKSYMKKSKIEKLEADVALLKEIVSRNIKVDTLQANSINTGSIISNGSEILPNPLIIQGFHSFEENLSRNVTTLNSNEPYPSDGVFTHRIPVSDTKATSIVNKLTQIGTDFNYIRLAINRMKSFIVNINYMPQLKSSLPVGREPIKLRCEMMLELDYNFRIENVYTVYPLPEECNLGPGLCGLPNFPLEYNVNVSGFNEVPVLVEGNEVPVYSNDTVFGDGGCSTNVKNGGQLFLPYWFNEARDAFECNNRPYRPYKKGVFVDALYTPKFDIDNRTTELIKCVTFNNFVVQHGQIATAGNVTPNFNGTIYMLPLCNTFMGFLFGTPDFNIGIYDIAKTTIGNGDEPDPDFPNAPQLYTINVIVDASPYLNTGITNPTGETITAEPNSYGIFDGETSATIKAVVIKLILDNPEDAQYLEIINTDPVDADHTITFSQSTEYNTPCYKRST